MAVQCLLSASSVKMYGGCNVYILYSLVYYDPYWMVVATVGSLLNVYGIYTNEGTERA